MTHRTGQNRSIGSPFKSSPIRRSSRNTTPDIGRHAVGASGVAESASTPEQNNSTQRELKKLEDYWTRHNPVKEDSPRLRSNRKTNFDVKECLNVPKKHTKNQTCASPQADTKTLIDLSESPFPETRRENGDRGSTDKPSTSTTTRNQIGTVIHNSSPNIFSKFADISNMAHDGQEKNTDQFNYSSVLKNLPNTCQGPITLPVLSSSQYSEVSESCRSGSQVTDYDSDDGEYIPPRKKLRSQVTKDELWEGIPLSVSFKRLAPLSKKPEAEHSASREESSTSVDTNSLVDDCSEIIDSSPWEDKYIAASSLESTLIYEDDDSRSSYKDDGKSVETSCYSIESAETHDIKFDYRNKEPDVQSTPTKRQKRKLHLPQTPQKRSARLREKSFCNTPETKSPLLSGQNSCTSSPCTDSSKLVRKLEMKSVYKCKGDSSDNVHTTENDSVHTHVIGVDHIVHEHDIPTEQYEEVVHTTDPPTQEETNYEEKLNSFSPERQRTTCQTVDKPCSSTKPDLLNKSISEILDCSTASTDVNNENTTTNLKEKPSAVQEEHELNETSSNESMTTESLLSSVESIESMKSELEQNDEQTLLDNEVASNPGSDGTNPVDAQVDKERKQRRSSRLAEIEKKLSIIDEALFETDEGKTQKEPNRCDTGESSELVYSATVKNEPVETDTTSACGVQNLFNKNSNKSKDGSKSVPPLRIRLKLPLQCMTQKQKTSTKSKLKADKKAVKDNTNGDEPPTTSGQSKQSQEKKTKKKPCNRLKQEKTKQLKSNSSGSENKSKKSVAGHKKGFTPVKNKKTKRYKKEVSRWSPPTGTNVELRLNSERRIAAAGTLLTNPMLDKHACVLWSSENRRHVQLSNAGATSGDIDEILRRKWEKLGDKEKLRYFQRARDAMRDENRHSNKRPWEGEQPSPPGSDKESPNPSLARFLSLDPRGQLTELKKRMHFYREVSPEEYNKVMTAYKEAVSYLEQGQGSCAKDIDATKSRSKQKKSKRKSTNTHSVSDRDAKYRKLLYEKVCENWEKIVGIWVGKKEIQRKILRDNYINLVRRLIAGESVDFCEPTYSVRLSEVLWDLRELERDRKLKVFGFGQPEEEFGRTLKRLSDKSVSVTDIITPILEKLDEDVTIETYVVNELINQIPDAALPVLDQQILDEVIPDCPTSLPCCQSSDTRHSMTSPTSFLTDLVAEDILASNQNVEFRGAVSLLSNKIIPSPAFVVPQYVNAVYTRSVNTMEQVAMDKNNNIVTKAANCVNTDENCVVLSPTNLFKSSRTVHNPIVSK